MAKNTARKDLYAAKKIKEAFTIAVDSHVESLSAWIEKVSEDNPAKALELVTKLADFILPRLQRNDITVNEIENKYDYSKLTEDELDTLIQLQTKCQISQTQDS